MDVHLSDTTRLERVRRSLLRRLRDRASAVVIGGGGLIGTEFFKSDVAFWANAPGPVILWGAGHNSHDLEHVADAPPNETEYAELVPFAAIGLRDWAQGFSWVPCASCMYPALSETLRAGKQTLFVVHRDLRGDREKLGVLLSRAKNDFDLAFNDESPDVLFGKINNAKQVVTNSFHAAYWSSLMQKPVVAIGGGTKITLLKHRVVLSTAQDWPDQLKDAVIYPTALEECRDTNVAFDNRVKGLVGKARNSTSKPPYRQDPTVERLADFAATGRSLPAVIRAKAPKVVHFIFGLSPTFGGRPFNIMHTVAVRSVAERFRPDEIMFHYQYEPQNEFYNQIKSLLTPRPLVAPDCYGSRPVTHFAHKSDIVRLEALRDFGGVYLDLDTITMASLDPILNYSFTIGIQGAAPVQGLCNAVMAAAPGDGFVTDWLTRYENFSSDSWDLFSVKLPYLLWRSGKYSFNVEAYDRFHWPLWTDSGLKMMFEENHQFPNALCHHLWESNSFPKYFADESYQDAVERVRSMSSTYGRLAREFI